MTAPRTDAGIGGALARAGLHADARAGLRGCDAEHLTDTGLVRLANMSRHPGRIASRGPLDITFAPWLPVNGAAADEPRSPRVAGHGSEEGRTTPPVGLNHLYEPLGLMGSPTIRPDGMSALETSRG